MTELAIARLQQSSEWFDMRLVKLEVAQDGNVQKLSLVPAIGEQVKDHETRIRAIERANLKLAGAVGVLCFVGSFGAQILVNSFTKKDNVKNANADSVTHVDSTAQATLSRYRFNF